MAVKYLKNPDTKEKFYPITKSDCIIDLFSINNLEIDRLFQDSLSVSKHQNGMSYLNLQGLIHYHSKIKDYISEIKDAITNIPDVQIYTAGENITIENNVISAIVPEVDLSGYATEQWVDDNYERKHEYVDLGLPSGTLWATCNVGATSPEDYGDYFAWGETEPKEVYNWENYKWGTSSNLTKYNTTDGKTILEPADDVVQVHLGGNWRIPTDAEWTELREQCTWTWASKNGVNGYTVIGPNGNSIFIPAAGQCHDKNSIYDANKLGFYWGSVIYESFPYGAYFLHFGQDTVEYWYTDRSYGQSVRPVREPAPTLDTILSMIENLEYATKQWVEEQGYIKSIPPHTVTINFYNDIDYAVWHNMVGDIEITSMQSTNVLDLYVSDGNNLNKQDIEIALDNGTISITNGSTLTFDVIKTTDANGFAAVTLTYNIK